MNSIIKSVTLKIGVLSLFFVSFLAFAADPGTVVIPDTEFLMQLFQSLGGLKGAGALGIAAIVVQLIMKALQTSFAHAKVPGKVRLLVVYGLSIATGVLGLLVSGVPIGAAFLHANTLAAIQVFLNQIFKQFVEKKD